MNTTRTTAPSWGWISAIGVLATIVINILANTLPLNGMYTGEISDLYPNLFTPAGFTFAIWGVIYLFLAWFSITLLYMAYRKDCNYSLLKQAGQFMTMASVANIGWIFAWHWGFVLLSMAFMLVLLITLISLYSRMQVAYGARRESVYSQLDSFPGKLALGLKIPVSVYLGWISVATIANVSALLVSWGITSLWPGAAFWTGTLIVVAFILGLVSVLMKGDAGYTFVIAWALLGIYVKRSVTEPMYKSIALIAIIASILLAVYALYTLIGNLRNSLPNQPLDSEPDDDTDIQEAP